MNICLNCGYENLYWIDSYTYEDAGYDGDGTVHIYHCPHCGADIEVSVPVSNEDNK